MGVCAGAWLGGDEGSMMGVCARAWLGGDECALSLSLSSSLSPVIGLKVK